MKKIALVVAAIALIASPALAKDKHKGSKNQGPKTSYSVGGTFDVTGAGGLSGSFKNGNGKAKTFTDNGASSFSSNNNGNTKTQQSSGSVSGASTSSKGNGSAGAGSIGGAFAVGGAGSIKN